MPRTMQSGDVVIIPDVVNVQFRDRVYQIKATEGVQVLVPSKFLSELKGLPEDVLSSQEAVSEVSLTP